MVGRQRGKQTLLCGTVKDNRCDDLIDILKEEVAIVDTALDALLKAAMDFTGLMKTNPFVPLIAASDFLNCFGDALLGWCHIWMATVASQKLSGTTGHEKSFYEGKIESAKFFINRTTSLVPAKCDILKKDDTSAMRISEEAFGI